MRRSLLDSIYYIYLSRPPPPPPPPPHCIITSSILSAGGRFLGFFVSRTFTKFWNVCDLAQQQTTRRVKAKSKIGLQHTIYTIILLKSVSVSKRQAAILARSSREMSQTVRIDLKHILSLVHVLVQPRNFCIHEKHPKLSRIQSRPRQCLFE